ncbi:hypothetical protein CYY_006684 [Polysphondylium violaceum]|uniref:TRAF-type domain-containing protein n=1 Tax=Polysphondylium violaceum TaxID=133409 RepID=A0A8J4PPU2_9MYCE|nr:hypothetical protein CYY_006684 [Polysphondylium violaceum]
MMKCPYSNLCENMNYGTFIDKHSRECEYRSIKCQCSVIMKFNEFENHQKQCPKSKISCPHCQTVFVRDSNHLETCDEMNISCHQCKTKIKRKEITDHIRDVCPETMTTCPLKYLGCGGSFFKKDKMAHLKSDQHINVCMDISDQPVFMTTLERGTFETKFQFLGINSSFSYQHGNQVLDITFDNLNDQPFAKDYDFRISIYDKNNNILDPGDKYCLSEITGILSRHKQNQAFQSIKLTIFKKNQSPQKI